MRKAAMPRRASHGRDAFDAALRAVDQDLRRLGEAAGDLLRRAVDAFGHARVDDAQAIVAEDSVLDLVRLELEQRVVQLLATQQPVARDLRWLASALVMATDLERLADHGEAIARATTRTPASLPTASRTLAQMDELVQSMLRDVLTALAQEDAALALSIVPREDMVDALRARLFRELIEYMLAHPHAVADALEYLIVAQHLERAADHVTNVAERVVYIVTGALEEINV